jgi:hypothetical protein
MKRFLILLFLCTTGRLVIGQELYVVTEPASNMAAGSIGVRLNNKLFKMEQGSSNYSYRLDPEVMFGVSKNLMVHGNLYASNMFQGSFRFEGASVYAKYRFLSNDDLHSHFRMAGFGKISLIDNPNAITHTEKHDVGGGVIHEVTQNYYSDEIDLDGNNSGYLMGIVATSLSHKVAISGSASYVNRWQNGDRPKQPGLTEHALNYSLSTGYLLFPRKYTNYRQTNLNLYLEILGSTGLDKSGYYLDVVPAIQFIFNSISRLDLAYRAQITGDMQRFSENSWLLRFEYNFLNAFGKNK